MDTVNLKWGEIPEIQDNTQFFGTDSWYRSLKCLALLYRWKLIQGEDAVIPLLRLHRYWSAQQHYQANNKLLDQLIKIWPIKNRKTRIWACLHIGPYGMIARALMLMGYKVAVLLRADVFEEQERIYRDQYRLSFGREADESDLIFIKADVGNPLLKLKEALQNGFQIIVFVDGQLGFGDLRKGWASVRLHGADFLLREGIAALSHWTDTPITALVLTRIGEQIGLRVSEDFYVKSRAHYAAAMQHVIDLVQVLDAEELLQWECLPTIFDKGQAELSDRYPEQGVWLPLLVVSKGMLFDIATGRALRIGPKTFEIACRKFQELGVTI